jgi:H+/Cl- antiporter ClcA
MVLPISDGFGLGRLAGHPTLRPLAACGASLRQRVKRVAARSAKLVLLAVIVTGVVNGHVIAPAIVTTLFGVWASRLLRSDRPQRHKLTILCASAAIVAALAGMFWLIDIRRYRR